ncbi:MAG: hypothetical protein HFJ37_00250 [Clostridia bacterium]|nr:hypothetical protein [Clostridia bacterium]
MIIETGKFYFIKDEFFELVKDKELCANKERGTKRPCFYCFKDKKYENLIWFIPISSKIEKYRRIYDKKMKRTGIVDTIVFGYVEGEERAFLIQNMFPTTKEYIVEKYKKQNRDVVVNSRLEKELKMKANKILNLVEKGYNKIVFPDIMAIKNIVLN